MDIARLVRATLAIDSDLWPVWEKIAVPVLAIGGENSDLLLPATLARMQRSGAPGTRPTPGTRRR